MQRPNEKCTCKLADFYDNILDIFSDGIYISDFRGTTVKINKAYEHLTGLKREDLIGKNVVDIRNEGKYDVALNPQVVKTGRHQTAIQVTQLGKQVLLSSYPVFDKHGKVEFVVTFVRDITSLTQMQEQIAHQQNLITRYNEVGFNNEDTNKFLESNNSVVKDLLDRIKAFAKTDATVLLLGETGVGKDVFARKIHENSPRSQNSFFKVDCTSLPPNLAESELFGYEAGAFSGANVKGKPGFIEMAHNGTLFLDEIGELPGFMQAKLLRVLQDQEIIRIGSTKIKKVDVRIIAATNRDLEKEVKNGNFRSDLYYRLRVGVFNIPPLRDRQDDIEILAKHFLRVFNHKYRKQISLSPEVASLLKNYEWPGNIRELENLMQTLVISSQKNVIEIFDLPNTLTTNISSKNDKSLPEILSEMEKDILKKALATHRTIAEVAQYLKVDRTTIFRKIKRYNL